MATHTIRIKSGVQWIEETDRWGLIMHVWQTEAGLGEPDQVYTWPDTYATEADAQDAYETHITPLLTILRTTFTDDTKHVTILPLRRPTDEES